MDHKQRSLMFHVRKSRKFEILVINSLLWCLGLNFPYKPSFIPRQSTIGFSLYVPVLYVLFDCEENRDKEEQSTGPHSVDKKERKF